MNSVVHVDIIHQFKRPLLLSCYALLLSWPSKSPDSSIQSLHMRVWVGWPPSVVWLAAWSMIWVWFQISAGLSSSPFCQRLLSPWSLLRSRTNCKFPRDKMATAWSLQLTLILCRGIVCVEVSYKSSYVPKPWMVFGQPYYFRRVSKILKGKKELSFVMSVRPSVCPNATTWQTNRRILIKFDIWVFFVNLPRKYKFCYNLTRITDALHKDLCTFLCAGFFLE